MVTCLNKKVPRGKSRGTFYYKKISFYNPPVTSATLAQPS